jgi:two-component system, chemotaxis family, chemotaxis protein CheY
MPDQRPRILLVDDDDGFRESLGDALEEEGFEVALANNGQAALQALEQAPIPDVILLDLLMPVMNGWEFCRAKKGHPRAAAVPVIALSAAVSADPGSPYFIEVDDSLAKPLELADLLAKIALHTPPELRR